MSASPSKVVLFLIAAGATVLVGQQALIRTERTVLADKGVLIKKTYRGDKCVLVEMDRQNRKSRSFVVNGTIVAGESDEDGDGFFETLMVFDRNTGDFECYLRSTNGAVAPMDPAALEGLKAKKSEADRQLREALERQGVKW